MALKRHGQTFALHPVMLNTPLSTGPLVVLTKTVMLSPSLKPGIAIMIMYGPFEE
jgi:hypothetical protein